MLPLSWIGTLHSGCHMGRLLYADASDALGSIRPGRGQSMEQNCEECVPTSDYPDSSPVQFEWTVSS